jgi:putative DNA-invertase from lambdoid prophage Rac
LAFARGQWRPGRKTQHTPRLFGLGEVTFPSTAFDRLFRSALDALKVVEELKGRGVKLHLLDIAGNGLSKLFLTIAAAFAEAERDRIRERIGQVKADQKARGRYLGGKIPFGFRRGESGELVPHEGEQEAVREMVALRSQGKPLRAIAEAVRTKGLKISHEGVGGVLRAVGPS